MSKIELKTAPLSIRIRPSLKAEIERLAAEDKRPIAQYVEMILEAHCDPERRKERERTRKQLEKLAKDAGFDLSEITGKK
jgi:hypothetical protein